MDDEQQIVDTAQDDQEWDSATSDFASDNDVDIDSGSDDTTPSDDTPKEESEKKKEPAKDAAEDTNPAEGAEAGEEPAKEEPETTEEGAEAKGEPDLFEQEYPRTPQDVRAIQREMAEDKRAIEEDIRKEVFGDVPTEIQDQDGDPIRTISDVMALKNPNTGEAFTEEEAAMWLMQAQRHLEVQLQEVEKQVDEIAETNLSLKDQSDAVLRDYGELLKAMPDLQQQIWAEYEKTLVKDEKSGLIVKAPVSLESFYRTTLTPYVKLAQQLEVQAKEAEYHKQTAERQKQEVEKVKDRSDRQDIYSGGKSDTMDPEEKEWVAAAKELYES